MIQGFIFDIVNDIYAYTCNLFYLKLLVKNKESPGKTILLTGYLD